MQTYGAKQLAASFRTVRGNTIKVVEELPEDRFDFVAAPGVRSLGHLLAHILFAPTLYLEINREHKISTFKGYDFGAYAARGAAFEKQMRTKAELVALLKAQGEEVASWMESLSDAFLAEGITDHMEQNPKSRLETLMSIKEHEMHHRAQLMLMLRMLGGVPHLTRERQARAAARAAAVPAAAKA